MKSVERLVADHELIERGLTLLEKAVARLEAGQSLPEGFAQWAPRFFQQFADQCHHAKEEDVFFPVLKQRGIPEQGGPIGVMLYEHGLGRDCVGRMGKFFPFYVTANEVRCSEDVPEKYHLFRVFDFARTPRVYILTGSLQSTCLLEPAVFRATI
jgi:hemerythrin-like domain-containing protein